MESREEHLAPEDALKDIRGIMARSTRFLSLSGWSGIWAGVVALIAAYMAYHILLSYQSSGSLHSSWTGIAPDFSSIDPITQNLFALAIITFIVAFAGAYFFTWRKAKASGQRIWNMASRQLLWQVMIPMIAGGIFCLAFLYYGSILFIAPGCLAFYGLGLVNGSKYTLGEIRYLGYFEVILGCICLFYPGYGLYFMAIGFGVLHILYGIVMWNKYDKQRPA